MKCDSKTLIKIAAGLGVALAVAYFALPASHGFIWAAAPFLLFLVCPIAMIFMMKSMNSNTKDENAKVEESKVNSVAAEAKSDKT
ncbi:MAG: DUF2933 domain-containing protein [Roseateles sp.]|jgi:hypothetical protein|uniref:DUF2933 domain-containing protein n=1 Tax=Burkholderiales TaxID=80840 RepID=UPI0021B12C65|nr:DUF2933 domain-containing protein [Acidovorax sp. K2F]MCT6720935.1 DUF2933 domain-containing protein [Acidovorax sp. K2F]|eukprot:gene34061-biopygen22115